MRLGGFVCMCLTIPGFVLCWVLPAIASMLLLLGRQHAALTSQMAIASACFCQPSMGVPGSILAAAITVAIARTDQSSASLAGSTIWFMMTLMNWGLHLGYSPAFSRFLFSLDIRSYFYQCELRGAVDSLGRSSTLFMFHPHGVITAGFSCNGIFSADFSERTLPAGCSSSSSREKRWRFHEWPGTIFLLTSGLREPSHYFKLLCDLTGRMESATRANVRRFMRAGRNLAILPGGFEEATLFEYGVHRVAIRHRKGIVKYALQHGYMLQPIYTFGENRTYRTATGLRRFRLWLNRFQVPCVAFWGDWLVPIFPRRDASCLSYVAPPLQLPLIAEPTQAQLDEWHAKYVDALQALFDNSKADAGEPDAVLEVW